MTRTLAIAAGLAGLLAAAPAHAQEVVAQQNYDAATYVAPGITYIGFGDPVESATVGAWNASGWAGNYSVNRSTGNPAALSSLSVAGLLPNSNVTILSGLLGFLESWDSTDGSCCTPDYLDVFINGSLVATLTSNNALGTVETYSGATELFDGVQVNGNGYYSDTLVDLSTASFANSLADGAGNWTLGFQARGVGWQGGSDEGWGIDDITLFGTVARAGAVPEPSTWAMLIVGFGMAGAAMRRRERGAYRARLA